MSLAQEQRIALGKPSRLGLIDCDIHPKSSLEDLRPYLSNLPVLAEQGLPLGMQMLGFAHGDADLFAQAAWAAGALA